MSLLFVFLILAALYESWSLPFSVLLGTPVAIFGAFVTLWWRGMQNNIYAQIGLIMLIGLAAKNAILIVEFARQAQEQGASAEEASVRAARTRLRPILMTSFAFILGVVPLVVATGAGSEMRQSLGTAVFAGMLGVTGFGLLFTPVFYTLVRRIGGKERVATKSKTMSQGVA
jgi:HAE1 family hydrophobic/amphiphilic exporter-1